MVTKKQWKMTFLIEDTPSYNFIKDQPMDLRTENEMKDITNHIQFFIEKDLDFKVVDSDVEGVKE